MCQLFFLVLLCAACFVKAGTRHSDTGSFDQDRARARDDQAYLKVSVCMPLIQVKTIPDYELWITVALKDPSCNLVTREEWGAKAPTEVEYMIRPVPYVIIEHTVTPGCNTNAQCIDKVAGIQQFHFGAGFSDIAQSFVVGDDGRVYEGRGWLRVGAHARGYNKKSIGIAFIGDFTDKLPKPAAIAAAKKLISCGVKDGHVKSNYKLIGHRQVSSTESPGEALYGEIQNWKHWASTP